MPIEEGRKEMMAGLLGAFVVGLAGSLHCLLMCGPLACAGANAGRAARRWHAATAYQLGRLLGYAAIGGALGGMGRAISRAIAFNVRPYLPWMMAFSLVAAALGVWKRLPALPGLGRLTSGLARWSATFAPLARAGAMGALTPLLPCGLLYGLYAAALSTGSITSGAALLACFAVGGAPALGIAQLQLGHWAQRSRLVGLATQRALPLLAAAVLVFRALTAAAPRCH